MKKNLILNFVAFATLFGTTVTMTSCGGNRVMGNFEIPEGGFDTETPVEITFYSSMGQNLQDIFNVYLEEFNELYPNITVHHESIGGYDDVRDQIKIELSTGGGPNIAYCYPDHVALYNKAGRVVTLDNLIESDLEMTLADGTKTILGLTKEQQDDFVKGYYDEGRQFGDDAMYTLPFSKSTEVLYYNKTFFDENKLTVPTTWDEMEEVCKKIKEINPDSIPLGYDSEANWFITMTEQLDSPYTSASGEHFLFDNETNRNFVKRYADWYDKGYVTTQQLYGGYTSGLFTSTTTQVSYMSIGSSAGATHQLPTPNDQGEYPFEVGIAPIPQADAENHPAVISQGPSLVMFKNEDPQKVLASWLLMKYMTTTPEFQAQFSISSGYVPVINSVYDLDVYKQHLESANGYEGIAALSSKVCREQEEWYFTSPAFIGSSTARDQVGIIMQTVMTDPSKLDEAFRNAIQECNLSA